MILDRGKFGDSVSDTATGELVSLVFCSSKEADHLKVRQVKSSVWFLFVERGGLAVMAICLMKR